MNREGRFARYQRRFLSVRFGFILAVAILGVCEVPSRIATVFIVVPMALGDLYLRAHAPFRFCTNLTMTGILLADTACVCGILVLASANSVFFMLFFTVLILTAYIGNLVSLAVLVTFLGLVSVYLSAGDLSWARVPLLTVAAQYYAFLISADRLIDEIRRPPPGWRPGLSDVHVIEDDPVLAARAIRG